MPPFVTLVKHRSFSATAALVASAVLSQPASSQAGRSLPSRVNDSRTTAVTHRSIAVDGISVFYREAGPRDAPTLLLLHGFPSSSHMYRHLIPALADRYHVVAPDFPGFGQSAMPSRASFAYTFANLAAVTDRFTQALGLGRYSLYVMDYGAPVGFRLAMQHPERVDALIIQNGNAYDEGLRDFWMPLKRYWASGSVADRDSLRGGLTLAATKWEHTHGARDTTQISPDSWVLDQQYLDRPGNSEIQLDLFYDYRTNVPLYPEFQTYFRRYQPPTLIVWGKNDQIFPWQGAEAYKRDLKTLEYHLLDTGHFALEENGAEIAQLIRSFLPKHVGRAAQRTFRSSGAR